MSLPVEKGVCVKGGRRLPPLQFLQNSVQDNQRTGCCFRSERSRSNVGSRSFVRLTFLLIVPPPVQAQALLIQRQRDRYKDGLTSRYMDRYNYISRQMDTGINVDKDGWIRDINGNVGTNRQINVQIKVQADNKTLITYRKLIGQHMERPIEGELDIQIVSMSVHIHANAGSRTQSQHRPSEQPQRLADRLPQSRELPS